MSRSHTLNNSSRRNTFRPNSAKKQIKGIKINISSDMPPPIIFTMPNNPKKLSGMGNKIEREQLYEYNMQLKDLINKLNKELAETKYQVVKKDIEIRKKERIIKECSKENDLESVHELNLEKARESTLVSLCKDKYNELKTNYTKKCEENEILKANIKITKLKEYIIQIDILKKETEKIKTLYLHTLEDNMKLKQNINEIKTLKYKYIEQNNIINIFTKKCKQYEDEINSLKNENEFLQSKLEQNMRQQKGLKRTNIKLKISNEKFLTQKKYKENYALSIDDNKKLIRSLRKDLNEYKRLYELKDKEYNTLKENNDKIKNDEIKKKEERFNLKPFDFNQIKVIENKKEDKNINKLSLYKSLLEESKHKITIYELYLKSKGIDKDQLIKSYGYDGIMTSSTKIVPKEETTNNNLINTESNVNNENKEGNEEINKEDSIKNLRSVSEINSNNINTNTNMNNNVNTITDGMKKLPSIEEEKQDEVQYSADESELLSLLHVFVKNLEGNNIKKEQINEKMKEISKFFSNKKETTKEDFLEPFLKMFIETMKITQDKDIEIIKNFLSDLIDSLNGETGGFFSGLIEIFENIQDYTGINKDREVSFELNKYKEQLINMLKQNDVNNNHLITFDIFRKIVQDLSILLDNDSMEYLIYLMKKSVPENNSIFDLNYEIIEKLLEKNEIGDIFANIKNNLVTNKINLDNECQDFLNTVEFQEYKFFVIKRDDFFSVLDKLNISLNNDIKNCIYEIFKIEIEADQYWMEYEKLKSELE